MRFKKYAVFLLLLGIVACSKSPENQSEVTPSGNSYTGHYKIGTPYKVNDTWYYPKKDDNYDEVGVASWYGPGFHGKNTANGSAYNQQSLTAAHRTLPLPCIVRITNLSNGRSVMAMVNDRGPFSKKRIIDVSERVADLIGIKQQGTGKVRVQYMPDQTKQLLEKLALTDEVKTYTKNHPDNEITQEAVNDIRNAPTPDEPASIPPVAPKPVAKHLVKVAAATVKPATWPAVDKKGIYIQAGAYKTRAKAESIAKLLHSYGVTNVSAVKVKQATLYRVRLGPLAKKTNVKMLLAKIVKSGNNNAIIVAQN